MNPSTAELLDAAKRAGAKPAVILPNNKNILLAANQDSDNVVTFRIDQETGGLEATGAVSEVPAPVCLTLIPAP